MTDYTPAGQKMANQLLVGQGRRKDLGIERLCNELGELRARVEALEVGKRPASKVYEISEPLKLTPEQAQRIRDLLAPNSKPTPNPSQIRSSLVERVGAAIFEQFENNAGNEEEARAAIREVALWLNEAPLDLYPGDRGIVVNALYDQANQ